MEFIQDTYDDFLASKIKVAEKTGIKISGDTLHPSTRDDQKVTIIWALENGRALIASNPGLGKTHICIEGAKQLHALFGGKHLIVTELGASETFVNPDPEVGEGARLGVELEYVTNQEAAIASNCDIIVTNYERVRNGEFDFALFTSVWLDEGSYLKNMASETTDALQKLLSRVQYKYIVTATPNSNETLELINYAHALGVCDRGQILTRFFQRNSTKAGELTLHPQHAEDFWLFISSFALFITKPSDLGFSDEGFDLPEMNVVWHEVKQDHAIEGGIERDGQVKLFRQSYTSLPDDAKIKRESIGVRVAKAVELVHSKPVNHFILWHHLEDERKALNAAFKQHPSYADIFGSQKYEEREKNIVDFTKGNLQILATKPELNGVGCNFQKHCHDMIFVGIDWSFEMFFQALCRLYRFGQKQVVNIHIIYTPEEYDKVKSLKEKWRLHNEQRNIMRDIVLKYGLDQSQYIEEKRRTFKTNRREYKGENYTLVESDCVPELQQLQSDSVGMILSSFPFGNHYEYTSYYNDFGHNETNRKFKEQLKFLLPELLRVLKPGRIAAIHLKNRIHYGSVTGLGFSIFHRFTHMVCDAMEEAGFYCMGFHYINTDVVAENNQTYRLGWTEMTKDATKMGAGIPEEIWLFRKAPTSNADAYADEPVIKSKDDFSRGKWQVDAAAYWRSNGNRLPTLIELKSWGLDRIMAWWHQYNTNNVYDYEKHIEFSEMLESIKKLSAQFMTLAPQSTSPYVWDDVNRMQGLNMQQQKRKQQNHICPMPFDEVDRLIELYSNEGDLILDPFGGLATTGVRAIKKRRKAYIIELNELYAKSGAFYLKESEMKNNIPTLFDLRPPEKEKSSGELIREDLTAQYSNIK